MPGDTHCEETTFDTLREALGEDVLFVLVQSFGGIRIEVPARASAETVLGRAIGVPALERLAALYGGNCLSVPLAKHFQVAVLNRRGLSNTAIARQLKMDETNVYRVLSVPAKPGRRSTAKCLPQATKPA